MNLIGNKGHETKEMILGRLAACRKSYAQTQEDEDELVLLENTMSALQDLLDLEKVEWRD